MHHTKYYGDIAVAKTILDLTIKGYTILMPHIKEDNRFDLVAYKDNTFYKMQCKYSSDGLCPKHTSWSNTSGTKIKLYDLGDFDYYAVYLPKIDKVVYPSIKFAGKHIAQEISNSATPFYWWEDFTNFTNTANKKSYKDFGVELTKSITQNITEAKFKSRKVVRPSKEELQKLVWKRPCIELSKVFGVSDKAIEKWCKSYGISKPPRGYWSKLKSGKLTSNLDIDTTQNKNSI